MRIADKPILFLFLALIIWMPLPLGSNRPWAWSVIEVISFGLTAYWFINYLRQKIEFPSLIFHSKWLFISIGLFAIVILIQILPIPSEIVHLIRPVDTQFEPSQWTTISIDPTITWIHLKQTLAFACLAFLTLALINNRQRLKLLAFTFIISGTLQALYGSFMTLSGIEYGFFFKKEAFHGVATGTYWNRNHFANYLILCLSMGIGLLLSELYQTKSASWREQGRRFLQSLLGNKIKVRICLAIMVIALVLSHSRMGNTAFFISLIISGFLWLILTQKVTKGSLLLLASLLVIDLFIVGAWFGIDKVKNRLETTSLSAETRDEVNRDTLTLISDQPLLGTGAGSFYTAFPQYRGNDINLYYDHTHNDYLQFVAEHGLIGVIPLIMLLFGSIYQAVQTMRTRRTLIFQSMAFAPMMACIAMMIHSTVDFSLQLPANAASFIIILSLSWVVRHLPRKA